ncbi:putative MFS family arabinose efflux permease [Streptosporangium becharense]|uniref:Putative MFS family arabinose efflux permease n=1 Tax=Streptosporangium becharense TaxID=1816182 RepID=A0A7W9ILT9_9ACTN|nr:MFS transporter [Streptosporangium becharense]MBB2910386.1 putative MFS family arabinose efflux permease [Streptosporangium becharense]MBB5823129.1 putative MFS family arabinose efflux permease [Streptosporangium becharense]
MEDTVKDGGRRPGVFRNRDFRLLWTGESISLFGSEITVIALPSLAVLVFGQDAVTVGVLVALQWLPWVLLGPLVGVLNDRMRRRRLMVFADVGRAVALGSLPLLALFDALTLAHLFVAATVKGVLDVIFQIAYQSHLPALLAREDLMDANAKTQMSRSLAMVFGRTVGGVLVGAVGAARAITIDAVTYLLSAVAILAVRKPEPVPEPEGRGVRAALADLRQGLSIMFGNRLLRSLTMMGSFGNLAVSMSLSMLIVYAYDDLGFSPSQLGIALGVGGVAFVVGATVSRAINQRVGMGKTLIFTHLVLGCAFLLLLTAEPGPAGFAVVIASQFLSSLTTPVANVGIMTMVQKATPVHLMGRAGGIALALVWGSNALGPLLGGIIASAVAIEFSFVLAAVFAWFAIFWVLVGSVHHIRDEVPAELQAT